MPQARILRLDALGHFALADGVRARALFGDSTMLNLVELDPGAVVPRVLMIRSSSQLSISFSIHPAARTPRRIWTRPWRPSGRLADALR